MTLPFTLFGVAKRFCGVPMSTNFAGSLSGTFFGGVILPAASMSAQKPGLGWVAPCDTSPREVVQEAGSTCPCAAAACTSIARAVAPAVRSGIQKARSDVEPPGGWVQKAGLAYTFSL